MTRMPCALLVAALAILISAAHGRAGEDQPERWRGAISMGVMKLDFFVTFTPADEGWTGTMDVPLQGLSGAALTEVIYDTRQIRFVFQPEGAPSGATFEAERSDDGGTADGLLRQFGQEFRFEMERLEGEDLEEGVLRRPQTPNPPFPYEVREVTYTNPADGITLAGTLTLPQGAGPYPAAILITGSGPQDRDETLFEHKPFAVIADHLTRHGIAVLRSDDRGVGESAGEPGEADTHQLAGDVEAALDFVQSQPEIDHSRVGLIGHSEGGLIAPMVAADRRDIAYIVLLAGPGLPGDQILRSQKQTMLRAQGLDDESIQAQLAVQGRIFSLVKSDADAEALRSELRNLVRLQFRYPSDDALSESQREMVREVASEAMETIDTRWFRTFLVLDPREALRRVQCPVLALNGSLDFQVPAKENLDAISQALERGGNPDFRTVEMKRLNHLFQPAITGLIDEYPMIEETFSTEALELMSDWILTRVEK